VTLLDILGNILTEWAEKRQMAGTDMAAELQARGLTWFDVMVNVMLGFFRNQKATLVQKDLKSNLSREGSTIKHMKIRYGPYKVKGLKVRRLRLCMRKAIEKKVSNKIIGSRQKDRKHSLHGLVRFCL